MVNVKAMVPFPPHVAGSVSVPTTIVGVAGCAFTVNPVVAVEVQPAALFAVTL